MTEAEPEYSDVAMGQKELAAWRQRLEERVLAPLSSTSWRYCLWLLFLLALIGWAIYAYSQQLEYGLIVTGMRDRISWGLYIISFVFFIGISHAGTLLSAILRVTRARWQMSITRMAEFITAVALMVAALFPLIDMGRADRILNLFAFGRWQSPLLWDIFAITTYLTGSIIYLFLPLIPDFALCRDHLGPTAPAWKRWFFTLASLGWVDTPHQRRTLERAMGVMMIVIIPVAVSVHTVVAWIFAMTLRDPFNSTIFGAFFVAGAIYSGIAAIIVLMALLRWLLHLEEFITTRQFVYLGYLLAALAMIMGYMNISEYLTTGYKMEEGVWFHIQQLTVGPFAPLFWFYLVGGILAPALLVLFSRTRNIKGMIAAAVLVLIGMFIERYLIVVAGFRVPLMSYAPENYFPSWVEWSILAGAFALFALIISVFAKLFPVVSIWEVIEHRGPEPVWGEPVHLPSPLPAPRPAFGNVTFAAEVSRPAAANDTVLVRVLVEKPTNPKGCGTSHVPSWESSDHKGLSRRQLLGISGTIGATALLTPLIGLRAARNAFTGAHAPAAAAGKRLRRWAMVIDLRRCDGCQSKDKPPQCTEACIQGHFAPEPMEWIQVYENPLTGGGTQFAPMPCQQCQNAPCVNVCPVGATFHTPEGVVLIDQERCIGCRLCMEACPYDRRFFNWGEPALPPEAQFMEYSPEHQSPAIKGTVMKCDFCPDLARAGRLPYCAQACPNNAIYYADLEEDVATNGAEVVKLSRFLSENSTYRQKENLGTEPRLYYIPGHGEAVGRDVYRTGRLATIWPWKNRVKGSVTWSR
jgi:Fe-S-cluster-containing dehydrogenase component/Ni/Fe-hydrogenase subunit HybB-like protein